MNRQDYEEKRQALRQAEMVAEKALKELDNQFVAEGGFPSMVGEYHRWASDNSISYRYISKAGGAADHIRARGWGFELYTDENTGELTYFSVESNVHIYMFETLGETITPAEFWRAYDEASEHFVKKFDGHYHITANLGEDLQAALKDAGMGEDDWRATLANEEAQGESGT